MTKNPPVSKVEVSEVACARVAKFLAAKHIPVEEEQSTLPQIPTARIGNFFLALVAISHQTSPLEGKPLEGVVGQRHLRGWDYLFAKLETSVATDVSLLDPGIWRSLSEGDVKTLFRDERFGERLTDCKGRASLLRDLGEKMLGLGWIGADSMYEYCSGRISAGQPSLLDVLQRFKAYSDPVRKKSFFFLALMKNVGTWVYEDLENLGPPVDYHEVRGHLRLGTVLVNDPDLDRRIRSKAKIDASEDNVLRGAVFEAINRISRLSGVESGSRLHYLFWNIFRSVCTRQSPDCFRLRRESTLPERYMKMAESDDSIQRCPFVRICPSASLEDRLIEPHLSTEYY